jgi:formylglycine-generating enzyme required for sulfatase activity
MYYMVIHEGYMVQSSFLVDATEVTQASFVELMGCNPSNNQAALDLPVENVSWYDALLYCNARSKRDGLDTVYRYSEAMMMQSTCTSLVELDWDKRALGYRLPTETEWEWACRADTISPYTGYTPFRYYWSTPGSTDSTDTIASVMGQYGWSTHNSGDSTRHVG